MDVVANNVANANTAAYKAESPIFSEFLMPGAEADDRRGPAKAGAGYRAAWSILKLYSLRAGP